jgi:mannose/fructose/N-acetylgalactosamine-specific phosphotransferase system component IIB
MDVSVFRIDDRLIHGQIITAWIAYSDAKTIVVADDKAAKDEFQQSLLKMATPDSVTLKILSLDDAAEYLRSGEDKGKVLLLVRGPEQALKLVESGVVKESINVGNMNMKKGKTKVLGNLWVFPEDVEMIKKIYDRKVTLEVRAIPSDRGQDVLELLKKNKLA